jgi:hypothetical protein
MQFAIGVTVLECSFVKHSHGPLGVKVGCCETVRVPKTITSTLAIHFREKK